MNPQEIHDLIGAYAIGALDDHEREEFEAHLATCDDCTAELASYDETLEALADPGTDDVESPHLDALAARIGAQIAVTPQDAQATTSGRVSHAPTPTPDAPPAPKQRRGLARVLTTAAASLIVAAAGVTLVLNLPTGPDTTLASEVEQIQEAGDVRTLDFAEIDVTAYVSATEGGVALVGTVPALDDAHTYQLWVVPADGTAPVPGPTMVPASDGSMSGAWLTALDGAAAVAVSVEPTGGSTTPTEVVAAVEL